MDEAIAVTGKQARRSDGKLPPHVMVYFAMALALFAEEDYEEVAPLLTEALGSWGCWDGEWSGADLGRDHPGPAAAGVGAVAGAVRRGGGPGRRGADPGGVSGAGWRLMAIDGFEWDAPDTEGNAAAFGYAGSGPTRSAFPKARVVTLSECGSHAVVRRRDRRRSRARAAGSRPWPGGCTGGWSRTGC